MKKMRKLIPAFAMLMVSAIMLSTASFAWFSSNTKVTATGMQVQATSSGGLAIAVNATKDTAPADKSVYASSVNLATANEWTNGSTRIQPVSNHAGTNEWFTGKAGSVNASAVNNEGYTAVDLNAVASKDGLGYFYMTQFYVKSLSEAHTAGAKGSLSVSQITVTNRSTTGVGVNLEKSLRIAVQVGSTWLYFAPMATTGAVVTTFKYVEGAGVPSDSDDLVANYTASELFIGTVNAGDANARDFAGATLMAGGAGAGLVYDEPVRINVYVYYEGEDPNCTTSNAVDLKLLGINIEFTTGV